MLPSLSPSASRPLRAIAPAGRLRPARTVTCAAAASSRRTPPPSPAEKIERLNKEFMRARGEAWVQRLGADVYDAGRRLARQPLLLGAGALGATAVTGAAQYASGPHPAPRAAAQLTLAGATLALLAANYVALKKVSGDAAGSAALPPTRLRLSAEHLQRRAEQMQRRMQELQQ